MLVTVNVNNDDPITFPSVLHVGKTDKPEGHADKFSMVSMPTLQGNLVTIYFRNAVELNTFVDRLEIALQSENDRVFGIDVSELHKAAMPDQQDTL